MYYTIYILIIYYIIYIYMLFVIYNFTDYERRTNFPHRLFIEGGWRIIENALEIQLFQFTLGITFHIACLDRIALIVQLFAATE